MTPNEKAFLDMIALSELGLPLLSVSDNGYNVIVGSTPAEPILFFGYADHPRRLVEVRPGLKSTAAGRYQLLSRYFDAYKASLHLADFSPPSQDAIALQQIKECKALGAVNGGYFKMAVQRCSCIWASLPGNTYGQHMNKLANLQQAFVGAGGTLAA